MIGSAALALIVGSVFGGMAIAAHLGPLAGLVGIGVLLVAFCTSEAVRKAVCNYAYSHNPEAEESTTPDDAS